MYFLVMNSLLFLNTTTFLETTLVFLIITEGLLKKVIIVKLVVLKQAVTKTLFQMCFYDQLFPDTHKCT